MFGICLAPGDFNMNWPLADIFMIEIDRWPRGVAPLASHIEDLQRKFEMRVLNRYIVCNYSEPSNFANGL